MSISRRRLFTALAVAGAAEAQPPLNLDEERMRVLKPVVDRRIAQLKALRELDIDDTVEPTPGILD